MNFLAHLFLASPGADWMLGGLVADFVRSRDVTGFPDTIQAGIRLHQRIDSFTDAHPVVAASKRRLHPPYRRFAGILLDMFYNHFIWRLDGRSIPPPRPWRFSHSKSSGFSSHDDRSCLIA